MIRPAIHADPDECGVYTITTLPAPPPPKTDIKGVAMTQGKEMPFIARRMDNQIKDIKALLLVDDGEFDDAHTADADKLAKIAEVLGLRVIRERDLPDGERGCASNCNAPSRIEQP